MYMGIDPGKSGAAVVVNQHGKLFDLVRFNETDDAVNSFFECHSTWITSAVLERVHSMPGQGVSSTFKFGMSFGFIQGLLRAHKISHHLVTPQTWQKSMDCMSGGNKNVTKAAAQELFPTQKVIHATADAFLLAEYCRRQHQDFWLKGE